MTSASITINNHNINPTITSNSVLNCDSDRDGELNQRAPIINSLHSEDSNSSSNMVIDESCNTNHIPPTTISNSIRSQTSEQETSRIALEPDLPPDREQIMEKPVEPTLPPIRLVVPKFKLRVPKEFQKSVDDALSTSESEEEEDEVDDEDQKEDERESENEDMESCNDAEKSNTLSPNHTNRQDEKEIGKGEITEEINQNSFLAESTPANSQDIEIERNSATESATEAGNSQDNSAYKSKDKAMQNPSLSLDDDDSLDEPNSNLVRIMQEIERTKLDIQRTKKTSSRHNSKQFASPRQPSISQSSNRTADHNWSPTPPASPNSRWFTPRRSTISQSGDEHMQPLQQHPFLLPPPSPLRQMPSTQERRDTIGSDMMDIDETITSQPTQTIYR